ncbi:MAG: hypothetical protein U0894_02605 [Pirellulales bacterium]
MELACRKTKSSDFSSLAADSSTTRRFTGTGLGLTISHRMAQPFEGRIEVESMLDVEATSA